MMRPLTRLFGVLPAALGIASLCQQLSAQTLPPQITFETTGDFGLDTNWSDPEFAPPENPPGAGPAYANILYYINDNQTATISHDSEHGSHFQVHHLFVGDSPFAPIGQPPNPATPGTLIMNGGPVPAPGEFGASLHVAGINDLRMGRDPCNFDLSPTCTGGGTIIMNGASDIWANGLIVGERSEGNLFIGPDARVRVGRLNSDGSFQAEDMRIGTYGPARGSSAQFINGNGFVEVEGTLIANTIYIVESDATGLLRVMPGATVEAKGINLAFEPFRPNRSATLEVIGSGGVIEMSYESLQAQDSSVTLSFTADAAGVTPIVATGIPGVADPGGALIQGANLKLDLDAFNFNASSTMMLIDVAPNLLIGQFGSVMFLGDTTADVVYDVANGNVFLNNFMSSALPGIDGDYNDDGTVDAADYVVWRKHNGTTNTLPNDTTPGFVSPVDYDVWVANFGMSSGSGAAASAIATPEPAASAMALLLCTLALAARRRRQTYTWSDTV